MKKLFLMLAAIAGLYAFSANDASAQRIIVGGGGGERIVGGGGGVPTVGLWLGGSAVCTAGTLIVAATIVGNTQGRELSQEEAATALVTCFVPPAYLLACNSVWRENNSLPPVTTRRGKRVVDPRHRRNVFCDGLTPLDPPVVVRAAY